MYNVAGAPILELQPGEGSAYEGQAPPGLETLSIDKTHKRTTLWKFFQLIFTSFLKKLWCLIEKLIIEKNES